MLVESLIGEANSLFDLVAVLEKQEAFAAANQTRAIANTVLECANKVTVLLVTPLEDFVAVTADPNVTVL